MKTVILIKPKIKIRLIKPIVSYVPIILIFVCSYSRYSERDSHRSEGEYEEERYVDRKEYDGKWADGNEPERPPAEEKPAEQQPPKE